MIEDRIEREILIEAPPEVVWRTITEPDQVVAWFSEAAELEPRAGESGALTWEPGGKAAVPVTEPVTFNLRIEQVERPHYFSFRWMHPAGSEPDSTNSLLVEFSLNPEGDHTRLRLVETGFRDLAQAEEETRRTLEDHREGWGHHLGKLRDHISRELAEPVEE